METQPIPIADVYVPVKRKRDLDAAKVDALAEAILEEGVKTPIQVRQDKNRLVLVEGLHRLEAARALGEETIPAIVVGARRF